jgi:two-component system cell cycle sensor histidine kinase/response regulator CckA
VTARVQAEQRQRELEAQLSDARRLEYVGRLAGGVAHDFNNILTVILGNAKLGLHDPQLGPQQRQSLAEIDEAAERAAQLTRRLLSFARRQQIEPRLMDIGRAVREMSRFLRRLLPENIDLVLDADRSLIVNADPGQIEQVVVNLAANARDAMSGGGRLELRLRAETVTDAAPRAPLKAGEYVVLAVRDAGVGIDPETLPHVFEPFFTTKPTGMGTGLGLATVWGIATQLGGHVFVASRVGAGTTFEVYLPRATGEAVPKAVEPLAARAATGETIIVVDDQPQVRQVVVHALEHRGFRVLEAGSASEARRLAEAEPVGPRLLLSDVVMPEAGGVVLARRLRARHPDLAVLFMSGHAGEVASDSALVPGAAFIAKPFSPDDLVARVYELLGRHH